jgi:hypothetical protein
LVLWELMGLTAYMGVKQEKAYAPAYLTKDA